MVVPSDESTKIFMITDNESEGRCFLLYKYIPKITNFLIFSLGIHDVLNHSVSTYVICFKVHQGIKKLNFPQIHASTIVLVYLSIT
jgi:hypothetical protein